MTKERVHLLAFNSKNNMYHYCSKCNVTRFSEVAQFGFNFNDFAESVINLDRKKSLAKKDISLKIGIDKTLHSHSSGNIIIDNVTIQSNKYLKIDEIHSGITFIKSPKASGKTYFLQRYVNNYTSRYKSFIEFEEDNYEEDKPLYDKDKRVLLIGHRQSLIGEICNRIDLNSYLKDDTLPDNEVKKNKERYGVCLDSLWKVEYEKYGLIIIDEVEQVLAHFLSETIGPKRYKSYENFSRLITEAKNIIVLDADISWVSFNAFTDIIRENNSSKTNKKVHIHINQFKSDNSDIKMYLSDNHLIEDVKKAVIEGKKIFISSNSKARISRLDKIIAGLKTSDGEEIKKLSVTSNNSKDTEVQNFILNIKKEILKYQVVLASPSLGTGIDITFNDDEEIIDHVFGFYETQVNNHLDIDQQLSRVRHPKSISVYVSPRLFNFESELGVAEQDIQREHLKELSVSNFEILLKDIDDEVSSFTKLCARNVSVSRHSMNMLRYNFYQA